MPAHAGSCRLMPAHAHHDERLSSKTPKVSSLENTQKVEWSSSSPHVPEKKWGKDANKTKMLELKRRRNVDRNSSVLLMRSISCNSDGPREKVSFSAKD